MYTGTMRQKHPNIFRECKIGSLTIPNRVMMPAMGTVLCAADGEVSDHQIAYYEARARGGTGLIVTEIVAVESELGKGTAIQTGADDDRFIPMLARLAQSVHKYPTRIFAQLHHAGNQSNSKICGGRQIVAPSEVASKAIGETPRALTTGEVRELVEYFASAALRCRLAGFDGVELHGAHGYLIDEFFSPYTNHRTDEYGGNTENRTRFAVEIIRRIRELCGEKFPIMVRLSADEFVEGGLDLEESKRIAGALEDAGADALDVSSGTYESMPTVLDPLAYGQGWRVYLAEAIKSQVDVPVATVGAIRQPDFAEQVLAEGRADLVALGRELIAEPDWVRKTEEGREDEIRHCIQCHFCIETIFAPGPVRCAVNPKAGRELEFANLPEDGDDRPVAIIGGGPAGLEAADVLAERGFRPIVYEAGSELGGQLVRGCKPPQKAPLGWYKDYLKRRAELRDIDVRLGTQATPESVADENPYAVILATGGHSIVPSSVEGTEKNHVLTSEQLLDDGEGLKSGERVVIVGAGLTGCESADMLAREGLDVSVVEMLSQIAPEAHVIDRIAMGQSLSKAGVNVKTGSRLTRIDDDGVEVESVESGARENVACDWVVLALGLEKPSEDQVRPWKDSFDRVVVIGDSVKPRRVAEAANEGFHAAFVMQ